MEEQNLNAADKAIIAAEDDAAIKKEEERLNRLFAILKTPKIDTVKYEKRISVQIKVVKNLHHTLEEAKSRLEDYRNAAMILNY